MGSGIQQRLTFARIMPAVRLAGWNSPSGGRLYFATKGEVECWWSSFVPRIETSQYQKKTRTAVSTSFVRAADYAMVPHPKSVQQRKKLGFREGGRHGGSTALWLRR